jgi:hypothetical protein
VQRKQRWQVPVVAGIIVPVAISYMPVFQRKTIFSFQKKIAHCGSNLLGDILMQSMAGHEPQGLRHKAPVRFW